MNRIINKALRLKNEFLFNYLPYTTDFVSSKKNKILMYHGVDLTGSNEFNTRHISSCHFEKHIAFLKKTCNVISLSDFFEKKFDSNKTNIAITFDDGYLNNFTIAKPILEKYQVPATFFITGLNQLQEDILWSDFLNIVSKFHLSEFTLRDQKYFNKSGVFYNLNNESIYDIIQNKIPNYNFKQELYSELKYSSFLQENEKYHIYWKLMQDEQIKETSNSKYITIGSHGYYHNNLGNIDLQDAIEELKLSKGYLENLIQKEINTLGYPDSSYSRELISEAYLLGFKYQVATENYSFLEDETDTRILTRKGVYNCDSCGNQILN